MLKMWPGLSLSEQAVLSVEGRADDPEAKVDFGEEYGIKHLLLRYAPVEKL